MEKVMYVTKKQVSDFIVGETKRRKINKIELLNMVKDALCELMEFPNDNKNQIKFYTKVSESLAETK